MIAINIWKPTGVKYSASGRPSYVRENSTYMGSIKNMKITESLENGCKNIYFEVPLGDWTREWFVEEGIVNFQDGEYVIKEVIIDNNEFIKIYGMGNRRYFFGSYKENWNLWNISPEECYQKIVDNANDSCSHGDQEYSLEYLSQNESLCKFQVPYLTSMEMIDYIKGELGQEVWFDTKNKILYVYDKMGKDLGVKFTNELKLKGMECQSSSYELFTRIRPIGYNGLSINLINDSSSYLENIEYLNERIWKIWVRDDITERDILKQEAQKYLDECCQPKCSYRISCSSIDKDVQIGDTLTIIDHIKKIKTNQRVVKIERYPLEPEKSVIEVSNIQKDFTKDYNKSITELQQQLDRYQKRLLQVEKETGLV